MKSQKTNWWLDAILYAGFLVLFFLDLTGIELHQWLGIIIGFLALAHLVLHVDWVVTIIGKFFGKIPNSARINLLLDTGIGLGFFLIIFTGIVMSTWLNLTFINYTGWKSAHALLSIFTLFALLIKLLFHWKWIIRTAGKCFLIEKRNQALEQPAMVQSVSKKNRREFLKVGAAVGVGAFIGVAQLHKAIEDILFDYSGGYAKSVDEGLIPVENVATVEPVQQVSAGIDQQPSAVPSLEATEMPSAQPPVVPTAELVNNQPVTGCQVRCPRGCSYPGRCRRYTDSNGNGKCDYGECL